MRFTPFVVLAFVAPSTATVAHAQFEIQMIQALDPLPNARFGSDVAVSRENAIVGAKWLDSAGIKKVGAVYFFERTPSGWVETQKLLGSASSHKGALGNSVDIDENTAVAGAWGTEVGGHKYTGECYVFEKVQGVWVETAHLIAPGPPGDKLFGSAVAVHDDTIVVGAERYGPTAAPGAAFVYRRGSGGWTLEAELHPDVSADGDLFGAALGIEGDHVLIGAPHADALGESSGAVFAFERVGTSWSQIAALTPSDGHEDGQFGTSVALDGDRALLTALGDDENGDSAGAAYVFERGPNGWMETAKLLDPDGQAGDELGDTCTFGGNIALLGRIHTAGAPGYFGTVSMFQHSGTSWAYIGDLESNSPPSVSNFANSMDIDGDQVFVGAQTFGPLLLGPGAVHVFSPCGSAGAEPIGLLTGSPTAISLSAGGEQELELATCPPLAAHAYAVLGTTDANPIDTPVDGVLLPLTVDAWFFYTLTNANSSLLEDTFGLLDGEGRAAASLHVPADTSPHLAGLVLRHAFLAFDVSDVPVAVAASESIALELVP